MSLEFADHTKDLEWLGIIGKIFHDSRVISVVNKVINFKVNIKLEI